MYFKAHCMSCSNYYLFLLSFFSVSVDLPANPVDISPEHFHHFLSMASSPPLPSLLKPHPQTTPTSLAPPPVAPTGSPSFAEALAWGEKRKSQPLHIASPPSLSSSSSSTPSNG